MIGATDAPPRAVALLQPAVTVLPATATFVARAAVESSSDDGGRSSSSGGASTPRCPDLNLDVPVAVDTSTSQSRQPVCLCYRLGLRAGEACSCQADGGAGFTYFRPLEQGQYI
jgi:transcription factor MYB, plant